MKKAIKIFNEAMCILMLSTGLIFSSCEKGSIEAGNDVEQGSDHEGNTNTDNLLTIELDEVMGTSATFVGKINVVTSELPYCQVVIYYSDQQVFNINSSNSVSQSSFDNKGNFTIVLSELNFGTVYNYCVMVDVKSEKSYGDVKNFVTLPDPYTVEADLNKNLAYDLSDYSANSFIISKAGLYKFPAVKGESNIQVGTPDKAIVLWESYGTSVKPKRGDLISGICIDGLDVVFQTGDVFKEGNALIGVVDMSGNILWSWHIWFTDQPQEQKYYNNAGIMMDRNLGATSATPGDVGALGLLYQWGRKDPFLGSSSATNAIEAESTIEWNAVVSTSSTGTIEYSISHPTTFIKYDTNLDGGGWEYGNQTTCWTPSNSTKAIYDPCPAGWRVPDGNNGIWSKALYMTETNYLVVNYIDVTFNDTYHGIDLVGKLGNTGPIWYPAVIAKWGHADFYPFDIGKYGYYWTTSPHSDAMIQTFTLYGKGLILYSDHARSWALPVRCSKDYE